MKYENEEQIRKDFARIFGWYKKRGMYDYQDEISIPEWSQVFAEIGKLLGQANRLSDEFRFTEVVHRLDDIENYIHNKKDQLL